MGDWTAAIDFAGPRSRRKKTRIQRQYSVNETIFFLPAREVNNYSDIDSVPRDC